MGSVPAHCILGAWSRADLLRQFTFRNVYLVDMGSVPAVYIVGSLGVMVCG